MEYLGRFAFATWTLAASLAFLAHAHESLSEYCQTKACELPLNWGCFSFQPVVSLTYEQLTPAVRSTCNMSADEVQKEIKRRQHFFKHFHQSELTKTHVYASWDQFGITYNNCTTFVTVTDFPKMFHAFLCTEPTLKDKLARKYHKMEDQHLFFPDHLDLPTLPGVSNREWPQLQLLDETAPSATDVSIHANGWATTFFVQKSMQTQKQHDRPPTMRGFKVLCMSNVDAAFMEKLPLDKWVETACHLQGKEDIWEEVCKAPETKFPHKFLYIPEGLVDKVITFCYELRDFMNYQDSQGLEFTSEALGAARKNIGQAPRFRYSAEK